MSIWNWRKTLLKKDIQDSKAATPHVTPVVSSAPVAPEENDGAATEIMTTPQNFVAAIETSDTLFPLSQEIAQEIRTQEEREQAKARADEEERDRLATSAATGKDMPDGTIYAGISPTTGKPFFTAPADAVGIMMWNDAMKYAADLNAHSHKDWRIPTAEELDILYENRNKGSLRGSFTLATTGDFTDWYWSATEKPEDTNQILEKQFSSGRKIFFPKDDSVSLRCVRG